MNLWETLFGHVPHLRHHGHLAGAGDYTTHVEGEADFQDALELIVGGRREEEAQFDCTAFLVPEPSLPGSDPVVAVHVSGCKIGTLNREQALLYAAFLHTSGFHSVASCDALIYGGWLRQGGEGYFQARLDLAWPLRLAEDLEQPAEHIPIVT